MVFATLKTSQGTIRVELLPQASPVTVANFRNLAKTGFYENLVFHRIVKGFMIQTGDPNTRNGQNNGAWGQGGSGVTVPLEVNSLQHDQGTVAMARGAHINSASSQFFINLVRNASLNGHYTVFGKVVEGLDVVQALGNVAVSPDCAKSGYMHCPPMDPSQAMLTSVTIEESP